MTHIVNWEKLVEAGRMVGSVLGRAPPADDEIRRLASEFMDRKQVLKSLAMQLITPEELSEMVFSHWQVTAYRGSSLTESMQEGVETALAKIREAILGDLRK